MERIIKLIFQVSEQASKLQDAREELEGSLVFSRFEGEKPRIVYEGGAVLLRWNNSSLCAIEFVRIMKNVGYITKDDFPPHNQ